MTPAKKTALLVICNPAAGARQAAETFEQELLPTLREHGREPAQIVSTASPGHAGQVVVDFLKAVPEQQVDVVLGSGDGTLHEILDAIDHAGSTGLDSRFTELTFALVPCGTANALYNALFPPKPEQNEDIVANAKVLSIRSMLSDANTARPLQLARTTFVPPSTVDVPLPPGARTSVAAVVTSTALHASILHDSEALRATHPGVERFKLAAQANITRWYNARARLFVSPPAVPGATLTPGVEVYDPAQGQFVLYKGDAASADGTVVELEGPFAYFLCTTSVDRLEPTFRIAPKQCSFPPPPLGSPATMDLVVVRPTRDPSVLDASEQTRQAFAQKCMSVMTGAYRDGAHINMRYGPGGEVLEGEGNGPPVVEYFRCNGWEWIPEAADDAAHLVCVDGEIHHIQPGGKAVCQALQDFGSVKISVYA